MCPNCILMIQKLDKNIIIRWIKLIKFASLFIISIAGNSNSKGQSSCILQVLFLLQISDKQK